MILSIGVGFGDYYRGNPTYDMPSGFHSGNITGFLPLNARLEYALSKNFSIAGNIYFDRFQYNYYQDFVANTGTYSRYLTNSFSLFGGGVAAVWLPDLHVKIPNVEPFIQIGLSLCNMQQSAIPQGDSTAPATLHKVTPVVKIGGRYYLSKARNAALFLDIGYDRQSVLNIGFSSTLVRKKGKHIRL